LHESPLADDCESQYEQQVLKKVEDVDVWLTELGIFGCGTIVGVFLDLYLDS